ncbi:hypothetical protein [Sphingomonas psychrotolerans]|uniref:Uncharacterized protein n=1 Tax=Sphingomonas psychrotolerans TaxID=1327635 RepID=A0A2K8MHQ6_9SPHN|nr:hypothetical protein [Sphingomonas psychrotolerans]ATY32524.1 hypothetical protein CVN68_11515 [Sphingomonas psychrotolerans]
MLARIEAAANDLAALLDALPDSIVALLTPIRDFLEPTASTPPGLIDWPILSLSHAAPAPTAGERSQHPYALAASAGVTIEAGSAWPYADPTPPALLRMGVKGELKPKASATLPFSFGTASASAEASAACKLDYHFTLRDPDQIYGRVVGDRLLDLVDPFDFDAVWEAFQTGHLAAIGLEMDGSAKLAVSVSVADTTALGSLVTAELGATIAVGVSLGGCFVVSLRAGDVGANRERQILARVTRERNRSVDGSLKLGATIDLAGLATKLHGVLAQALGRWDEVLQAVTPFLSPGSWLRAQGGGLIECEAAALVGDTALRAALVRDLQGVTGFHQIDTPALIEWLETQLTGALDAARDWAHDQANAAVDMLDTLGRGLPAFAQPDLRALLAPTADKLVSSANAALEAKVDALFTSGQKSLGKALKSVGVTVSDRLADADAALAGVRALIARYDALFRKLLAATEDAANAKVSAALQIDESRLGATTAEIEGVFVARSDAARSAFAALTRGDLGAMIGLIDTPGNGDFMLDPARSSIRRFAGRSQTLGIELVLLGFGLTGSALLSAEADVLIDGTGKVQVDAKSRLRKRFSGLDADREIELLSGFALVRARALATASPAADRSLGLGITMGHIDQDLERHEVERFVGSLVDSGVIDASALATARSVFDLWASAVGAEDKLAGTLQLKLSLDRAELSTLLELQQSAGLSADRRRAIVSTAFDRLIDADPETRRAVDETIAELRDQFNDRSRDDFLMDRQRTHRALMIDVPSSRIPRVASHHEPFDGAMQLSHGMLGMVEALRQIYFSTPETRADKDPLTWGPTDYRDAEYAAVKAVRGWLQLNAVLFWTNSKVHPRTLAFLDAIATLGGVDLAQRASLTMWRKAAQGRPETIVLSHAGV